MGKSLFFLICIFCLNQIKGQSPSLQWAKQLGGTGSTCQGTSITYDQLGNIYTIGNFTGIVDFDPGPSTYTLSAPTGWDIFISKFNAIGNLIWAKQFSGGSYYDYGSSIFVDASYNIFTTGTFLNTVDFDPGPGAYTFTSSGIDVFISKLDVLGNFVWAKQIGGVSSNQNSTDITIDALNNVLITGAFSGLTDFDPGPGTYTMYVAPSWQGDAYISKLDASGNFVWAKQIDGMGDIGGTSIETDASGNVYTTGVFQSVADFDPGPGTYTLNGSSTGIKDIYISKLDASGNFVWVKQMKGNGYDEGYSIKLDPSGNIYSTGIFQGTDDFDPGPGTYLLTSFGTFDVYVSKLDASGNFLWAKGFGGIKEDWGYSLALDVLGNVYTTGEFKDIVDFDPGPGTFTLASVNPYTSDIFISKLDASGNFAWAIQIGDTAMDAGNSITVDGCGNVFTTGYFRYTPDFDPSLSTFTLSCIGSQDAFVYKINQGCSIGINENNALKNINFYPNPVLSFLNISSEQNNFQKSNIEITNYLGQTVLKTPFKNQLDVSSLSPGYYFIKINSDEKNYYSKFVKD